MPQFEQIGSFAGQIFWLVIFYGILLLLLYRGFLPRIGEIMELRRQQIRLDAEAAEKAHQEAERALEEAETARASSKSEAYKKLNAESQQAASEREKRLADLEADFAKHNATAREDIDRAMAQARDFLSAQGESLARLIVAHVTKFERNKQASNRNG